MGDLNGVDKEAAKINVLAPDGVGHDIVHDIMGAHEAKDAQDT